MNDAADKYSPEIAEAFHPTDTDRPATKKSPAVFEVRADQNPIAIVATTVTSENAKTHPSNDTGVPNRFKVNMPLIRVSLCGCPLLYPRCLRFLERNRSANEVIRNHPHERKEKHPEQQPRQRESRDALRHEFRREIVQQRQS